MNHKHKMSRDPRLAYLSRVTFNLREMDHVILSSETSICCRCQKVLLISHLIISILLAIFSCINAINVNAAINKKSNYYFYQ
jgi:uncharacterized integral membrane protein